MFADIVNVLLLDGKPLILPKELKPAKKDSIYKDKDLKIRMQERDVAKVWTQGNIRLALFGLEDQTVVDYDMPLRIIGYDSAVYRAMLLERDKSGAEFSLYPAITMILHFDYEKHWTGPRTLKECFKNIPAGLEPYVSDYKINVFEIAWLPDETLAKFKSDFRYVADYYSQMRKQGKWQPMPGKVKHIKELFDLFNVVTKDNRFIEMYQNSKGEVSDMSCVALDYLREDLRADVEKEVRAEVEKEVRAKERNEGKKLTTLNHIRNLMNTAKWTAKQAMDALLIPKEEQNKYMERL